MKRNLIITLLVAFVMVAGTASAGTIKNTKHDFSGSGWTTGFQICQPCHTPHNAQVAELLWNHDSVGGSFKMYSSYALDATIVQPDATSLKCLSCHDGSIALDAFGGAGGATLILGSARIGRDIAGAGTGDLSNDHPIGFSYTAVAGLDAEIDTVAQVTLEAANLGAALTANDTMGCYTCHDVHNTDTPAGVTKLLRNTNVSSALCLACHIK